METCDGFFIMYRDMGGFVQTRYRCKSGTYAVASPTTKYCPECAGIITDSVPRNVESRVVFQVEISEGNWEIVV